MFIQFQQPQLGALLPQANQLAVASHPSQSQQAHTTGFSNDFGAMGLFQMLFALLQQFGNQGSIFPPPAPIGADITTEALGEEGSGITAAYGPGEAGGCFPIDPPPATTLATYETGGDWGNVTTMAAGEEGGGYGDFVQPDPPMTTHAAGEEGGGQPGDWGITLAAYETGGDWGDVTTLAAGEEGGGQPGDYGASLWGLSHPSGSLLDSVQQLLDAGNT